MRTGTAFFKPSSKGIEGPKWETMYNKYVEMRKAVNLKKPVANKKAKARRTRDTKADGEANND